WEINKDASGSIHILNKDYDFVAVDSNFFDGNWHQFTMILKRSANLSVYIDGNLQNSVQALNFGPLSGSFYTIGARGYILPGGFYTQDNYYSGSLDEVRIWNLARKVKQIKRDLHNRLRGDEFGLLNYVPFE